MEADYFMISPSGRPTRTIELDNIYDGKYSLVFFDMRTGKPYPLKQERLKATINYDGPPSNILICGLALPLIHAEIYEKLIQNFDLKDSILSSRSKRLFYVSD